MAGVLADTGAADALNVWISNQAKGTSFTVHLFATDVTPVDTTTEGDLTEAAGGGYSSKTVQIGVTFVDAVAITSSSAANPTNILSATHGLSTNDYVTISGHGGSATDINGTHQVTVVDTTNFTIPVDLTGGGGTGGTLSRGFERSQVSGIEQAQCALIPFVFTGTLTTNPTIYGYYIKSGSTFIMAESINSYTPTTNGDVLRIQPTFKLSKGTAT